jgi:hypothetical protein
MYGQQNIQLSNLLITKIRVYSVLELFIIQLIICNILRQRFSNFFQVGTTFISHNVLQTTLLLSALKANCLRFSTIVCDTQFTLILFFLPFLD